MNELGIVQYRSAVILNSDELRQAAASPFEKAQRDAGDRRQRREDRNHGERKGSERPTAG